MARRRRREPSAAPKTAPARRAPRTPQRGTQAKRREPGEPALRRLTETFEEQRFEPKASHRELVGVLLLSFGALGLGAGLYAQFLWNAPEAPSYAPFVLALGIVLTAAYALYQPAKYEALVVGELGVGFEHDGKVTRTAWYQLQRLTFAHDALRLETTGKPLLVEVSSHPSAAQRILAEARRRIPKRVDIDDARLPPAGSSADTGEEQEADPPQVTEMTCRATERPLSVEKDVRMCSRCGVLYHKSGVPTRCAECGRKLAG